MMLSASPLFQHSLYVPTRPSPLAERSANVLPRAFTFAMASPPNSEKKVVPQRTHKPNPAIQSRDAATQRRREMFFNRVQRDRDDRKWKERGDQIQRLDFVSEQKRWEAEKARQAPELEPEFIDESPADERPEPPTTSYSPNSEQHAVCEMTEADYVLAQEEYELQALIAAMEEGNAEQETKLQHYGSDDEDYDQIFLEYVSNDDLQQQAHNTKPGLSDPDAMDMTDG